MNDRGSETPKTELDSRLLQTDVDLEKRLINWRNERPIVRYGERNARGVIVSAMLGDLQRERVGNLFGNADVLALVGATVNKLENETGNRNEKAIDTEDSLTKEPYTVRLYKTTDAWVAEEIKPDGSVISQARISRNGQTELTLHFKGERYESKNANPNITSDRRFPNATARVFNLLGGRVLR